MMTYTLSRAICPLSTANFIPQNEAFGFWQRDGDAGCGKMQMFGHSATAFEGLGVRDLT